MAELQLKAQLKKLQGDDFGTMILEGSTKLGNLALVPQSLKQSLAIDGNAVLTEEGAAFLRMLQPEGEFKAGTEIPDAFLTKLAVELKDRGLPVSQYLRSMLK